MCIQINCAKMNHVSCEWLLSHSRPTATTICACLKYTNAYTSTNLYLCIYVSMYLCIYIYFYTYI